MNTDDRQCLRDKRVFIIQNLYPDETFWSHLLSKGILTEDMLDEVKSHSTKAGKIAHFLDILPTRGPNAFRLFCSALTASEHSHVVTELEGHVQQLQRQNRLQTAQETMAVSATE